MANNNNNNGNNGMALDRIRLQHVKVSALFLFFLIFFN